MNNYISFRGNVIYIGTYKCYERMNYILFFHLYVVSTNKRKINFYYEIIQQRSITRFSYQSWKF